MSKIAPTLQDVVEHGIRHCEACKGKPHRADGARAELRALLSVVRAADRLVNVDRTRHPGTLPGSWSEAVDKTQRALARLSRAGRGRGK